MAISPEDAHSVAPSSVEHNWNDRRRVITVEAFSLALSRGVLALSFINWYSGNNRIDTLK